ncbi:uncharacterized protein K02A2.6-like [Haliotis rufescens]|uniref:uncharacterized protein K02A2.6-like n=1 Tax=Haliotis rufescens TaxID=6454 RepID=UPI00201F354B|nr:uncharacterized protein K02A2.6-like [Haliotis rufescens]
MTCIGTDVLDVIDGMSFDNEDDRQKEEVVLEKLKTFCIGETNETYERYNFNTRDQDSSEVDICRAYETAALQLKNIGAASEEVKSVKSKKKGLVQKKTAKPERRESDKVKEKDLWECRYCGRKHIFGRERCPAYGHTCSKCKKKNHFADKCPKGKKKKGQVQVVDEYDTDEHDEDAEYIMAMHTSVEDSVKEEMYQNKLFAKMTLKKTEVKFQLDCGATVNLLPETLYSEIYDDPTLDNLQEASTTLIMYNGAETSPLGKRRVMVVNPRNNKKYSIEFLITKGNYKPLLGSRVIQHMGLITVNRDNIMSVAAEDQVNVVNKEDSPVTMKDVTSKYPELFEGDGKLEGELHLEIDESATPVQIPCRKVPVAMKPKLKDELERLVKMNIITPVTDPTDWISAMVVVVKPNGKIRLCIDPKPLNEALKRSHYLMPTIDDILPELANAKYFTLADAKNGFWHIVLDKESSLLTTFETPWGRFRWLRMPFGISPAPEEFQRRMDEALIGLPGVKAIHDDVLIYGCGNSDEEAEADHDRNLRAFLERCKQKKYQVE